MTEGPFRLIAWNIRAGGGTRAGEIVKALLSQQPDAIILSEFRSTPASQSIARALASAGLGHQADTLSEVAPKVNALLIAARTPINRVALRSKPREAGRWLMVRLTRPKLVLGGMHIPNQHTGRKPAFHEAVVDLTRRWRGGPAILAGDTNSGKIGEDEERPVFNQKTHRWFQQLENNGWADSFRHLHGDRREYTWYSPGHNNGFRLDQAFVSPHLKQQITAVRHLWLAHPGQPQRRDGLSDHAALVVDLDTSSIS